MNDTSSSETPTANNASTEATFTEAEQDAFEATKAQGHRNPAAVRQAFLQKPITVGSITLKPLNLAIYMLLEEIESPLIEEAGAPVNDFSIRDLSAAVFILTADEDAAGELIDDDPTLKRFYKAVRTWAKTVPALDLMELGQAVALSLTRAMETVLPTTEKKTEGLAKNPSTEPKTQGPETASGGR